VVLPQPLSPTIAKVSAGAIEKLTPATAVKSGFRTAPEEKIPAEAAKLFRKLRTSRRVAVDTGVAT
jgi:hypothetical protein